MAYPDLKAWRMRGVRLGNPEVWKEIIKRYRENNPHLSLAVLASQRLTDDEVGAIHDRLKEQKEKGVG